MGTSIIVNLIFAVPVFATVFGMLMWAIVRSRNEAPLLAGRNQQAILRTPAARTPERRSSERRSSDRRSSHRRVLNPLES